MAELPRKIKDEKRQKDEDLFKNLDSTINAKTYLNLINIARRLGIEEYLGAISSGKEAKVYPARTYEGKYYAVKVYYTSTAQSKKAIKRYTIKDIRFEDIKANNTRQLIRIWAKKEFKNLIKMHDAGVRVPKPILVYENILVMEFIGENGLRAPLLKELDDSEIVQSLYEDLLQQMEIMVKKAKLVHGDLSEYNVMVYNNQNYIIDVSQAIPIDNDEAYTLLKRDLQNINAFFKSKGIDIKPTEKLLIELGFSGD